MNGVLPGSALLGLLLASCSAPLPVEPGSAGAGGEDGAVWTGGGGDGGGAPVPCGGSEGDTCSETEYCDAGEAAAEACNDDAAGVCAARPRPQDCPEDCPGVCGCDQRVYCNECLARAAGVKASKDTACSSGDYVIGAQDRVYVHSADLETNRCLTLSLAWPGESDPRFTGVELPLYWALLDVALTGDMRACTVPRTPGGDGLHVVTGASGAMSWESEPNTGIPCVVDMDVTVELEGEPGTYRVEETGVVVDNTCLW
ncbi:hypothetical protein [Sorangium sp. So ce1335]|uniref:hypothetical protein n=1 Tax=Sorangium sp. So ce1335 TaxID=3133335 RepID=UPI003F643753